MLSGHSTIVKADLHNHLNTSGEFKEGDFDRAVDVASRRLGSGGVLGLINFTNGVVDDRYETLVSQPGVERDFPTAERNFVYVPEKKLYVVKGQEIPTKQGHVLVLGIENGFHIKPWMSLEDTIKAAKDHRGIIIADHPFGHSGIGPYLSLHPELAKDIHAIEVHNGEAAFGIPILNRPFPYGANTKAKKFMQTISSYAQVGALSTSDGHSLREVGSSWTKIEELNPGNLLGSLGYSVRYAKADSLMSQQSGSYLGAISHMVCLAGIIARDKFFVRK